MIPPFVMIFISICGLTALLVLLVGTIRYDVARIRNSKEFASQPYAQRWRRRPVIHVVSDDNTDITYLRKAYRKLYLADSESVLSDGLTLYLPSDASLRPSYITAAVQDFNADETLRSVELPLIIPYAPDINQLFANYRHMITWPIATVRMGLNVRTGFSERAVMSRDTIATDIRARWISTLFIWILSVSHAISLAYVTYLAWVTSEPTLFFTYIGLVATWVAWAISSYPNLSLKRRIGYIFLIPSVLGYIVLLMAFNPITSSWQSRFAARHSTVLS